MKSVRLTRQAGEDLATAVEFYDLQEPGAGDLLFNAVFRQLRRLERLHGFHGKMPGSTFVSTWGWYTELCTFVVLFAGASGVYLWTQRKNECRVGYILIGAATAFSIGLMIFLTVHG